jgi:L-seryl-tRNA(Ser) seleniumtransferase
MSNNPASSANLRALPSIDALLRTVTARSLVDSVGLEPLTDLARAVTERLRVEIASEERSLETVSREALLHEAERRLDRACKLHMTRGVRRVINATGVVLHTNLGRAPLSAESRRAIADEAGGYCTLEYDLSAGKRGPRGARVERLLERLTGAEAALIVNNCAAAALLILSVLAREGETIVSRGELVEIGGDFRVPDVMAQSGTRMIEVGTTNRTRLADYQRVITAATRLIMRVHPSNYRIVGFTASPTLPELAQAAHERGLPLYEDAGSGALFDFAPYGLKGEPLISQSVADGADVISFSGDKLLGGPQAGLIVGRREIVERLRKAPLYRALRADKLALAALEATLDAYNRGTCASDIPTVRMITTSPAEIESRARSFITHFAEGSSDSGLELEILPGESAVGGGAAPTTALPTTLIAVNHGRLSTGEVERSLRVWDPPIISRIADDQVLLDLRTVQVDEEVTLLDALKDLAAR